MHAAPAGKENRLTSMDAKDGVPQTMLENTAGIFERHSLNMLEMIACHILKWMPNAKVNRRPCEAWASALNDRLGR